jgi:hypothetical protein
VEYVLLVVLLAVAVLLVLNRRNADAKFARVIEELRRNAAALPGLIEGLDVLEQRIHTLDPEPVRAELAKLRLVVDGLASAPPTPEPIRSDEKLPRSLELRRLVERSLAARGMTEIRLLNDASEMDADELEVRVEAVRDGLVTKGRVHVVGTEVRAVQLDDTLRQFP